MIRSHQTHVRHASGFTLIEVMIVVAIIGILSAIAYPSYKEHIARSRRAEAQTALLQAAQYMQRFYAANNRYDKKMDGTTDNTIPDSLANVPSSSTASTRNYVITISASSQTTYTLTATRRNGGPMGSDACGNLTLNSLGVKDVSEGTKSAADCWK